MTTSVLVWVFAWDADVGDQLTAELRAAHEDWPTALREIRKGDREDHGYELLAAPEVAMVDHERAVVHLQDNSAGAQVREVLLNLESAGDRVFVDLAVDRALARRDDRIALRTTLDLAPGGLTVVRPRPDVGIVVARPQ